MAECWFVKPMGCNKGQKLDCRLDFDTRAEVVQIWNISLHYLCDGWGLVQQLWLTRGDTVEA